MNQPMKKALVFLICLFVLLFIPHILWQLGKDKELQVVILDKTVPTESMREHSGLIWILNHFKYQQNNEQYDVHSDYYGFRPDEKQQNYEVRPLPITLDDTDLIYMADTYGVYEGDLPWTESSRGKQSSFYMVG